jgi:hypothetical protein
VEKCGMDCEGGERVRVTRVGRRKGVEGTGVNGRGGNVA